MAKKRGRSSSMVVHQARVTPGPTPTIRILMPRQSSAPVRRPRRTHRRRRGGALAASGGGKNILTYAALAGAVLAILKKQNLPIPTIPMLGKKGTLAVILWALGKYAKVDIARRLTPAALAMAVEEFVDTGKISGDD